MNRKELKVELFGKTGKLEYSEKWLGYSILGLRGIIAWVFIQAGLEKILAESWTAEHFLTGVPEANPFASLFTWFAAQPAVDPLVMYGQLLIGIGLLTGTLFRLAALAGGIQMILFSLASLEGGIMQGLPVEHGYLVTETLVYAVLLFGLGAWGAGRILGVDSKIEEQKVVQENKWLKYILG